MRRAWSTLGVVLMTACSRNQRQEMAAQSTASIAPSASPPEVVRDAHAAAAVSQASALPTPTGSALAAVDESLTVAALRAKQLPDGAQITLRGVYLSAHSPSIETRPPTLPGTHLDRAKEAALEAWQMAISDTAQPVLEVAYCNLPRNPAIPFGKTVRMRGTVRQGVSLYPCEIVAVE